MKSLITTMVAVVMAATTSFAAPVESPDIKGRTLAEVNDLVANTANKWEGITGLGTKVYFNNSGVYSGYSFDSYQRRNDDWVNTYKPQIKGLAPKTETHTTNFIYQKDHFRVGSKDDTYNSSLGIYSKSTLFTLFSRDETKMFNGSNQIVTGRDIFVPGQSELNASAYLAGGAALIIDKFDTTAAQTKNIILGTAHEQNGKKYFNLGRSLAPVFHPLPPAPGTTVAAE